MRKSGLVHGWGINITQEGRHFFQRNNKITVEAGETIGGGTGSLGTAV